MFTNLYSPLDQFDLLSGFSSCNFFYKLTLLTFCDIAVPVTYFYESFLPPSLRVFADVPLAGFLPLYFTSVPAPTFFSDVAFFSYSISFFVGFFVFILIFYFIFDGSTRAVSYLVPSVWNSIFSAPFLLIETLIRDNLGFVHMRYMGHIWLTFSLVFLLNILGMVPFFFTLTSHFVVTFTFSGVLFFGFNLLAIRNFGFRFFNLFIPSGSPAAIRPLLVYIEVISYFARVLSLSIRLFANMTAGHTLLKILAGYTSLLIFSLGGWTFVGIGAFSLTFFITVLEFFIAALQAYVFVMLLCVYLNDVLSVDSH